jgi:hypothetical protein
VPVLAGAPDADRLAVVGNVGHDDDFRTARHAPALAKDVELDLAEATGESDLLLGRDPLVAKEQHAILVVGVLDRGEGTVVHRLRQVEAADFRAEGSTGWNDIEVRRHRPSSG